MFHWKTDQVVADLAKIPGVKKVVATGSGGDHDTTVVVVSIEKGEPLHVCGFESTEKPIKDPNDAKCPWVEVTDGLDSRGGLNSKKKNTALVYVEIRQYFLDRGADVINHYNEIF